MASIENINKQLLQNDYNYYFMYRINKYEWKHLLERPFLINIHNNSDIIFGQFITSNWFKSFINLTDNIEVMVIKLPKKRNKIHPENNITIDMILYYLIHEVNYQDLAFVVMYYKYDNNYIQKLCNNLNSELNLTLDNDNKTIIDIIKISDNKEFGITFGCSVTKQKNDLIEVLKKQYYITCPNFVLKQN
tara:strand:+ start:812 stop:1381 length:570 start_codon:yes stop_codon:yes gene_type:complete